METTTFKFSDRSEAEAKLKSISKKASKFGLPFNWKFVGCSREEQTYNLYDPCEYHTKVYKYMVTVYSFEVCWETPNIALNGWQFEAVGEMVELLTGENRDTRESRLVYVGNSDVLPEKYTSGSSMRCEHCNKARRRDRVFLVSKSSGGTKEYKQVGGSCVRDFLGNDAEDALNRMAFSKTLYDEVREVREEREASGSGWGRSRKEWPISMIAAISASFTKYISAQAEGFGTRTSHSVNECMTEYFQECERGVRNEKKIQEFESAVSQHLDFVEEAFAYYRSKEFIPKNGFDFSLQTAANLAGCEPGGHLFGVLCYLPWAYRKHIGWQAEKAANAQVQRASEYIEIPPKGAKHKRIVVTATVTRVLTFPTAFGISEKIMMKTLDGDVISCPSLAFKYEDYYNDNATCAAEVFKHKAPYRVSSAEPDLYGKISDHAGSVITFSGIPSKHSEYRGVKQTHFTHCTIMEWVKIVENGETLSPEEYKANKRN